MKHLMCLCAAAAFALVGATAASASDHNWDNDGKHGKQQNDGDWKSDSKHDGKQNWKGDHRKGWNKDWDRQHGWWSRPQGWRGHSWRHGQYFRRYPGDNYFIVADWWFYGLPPPPPGYRWVRTWDGFILIRVRDNFVLNFVIR